MRRGWGGGRCKGCHLHTPGEQYQSECGNTDLGATHHGSQLSPSPTVKQQTRDNDVQQIKTSHIQGAYTIILIILNSFICLTFAAQKRYFITNLLFSNPLYDNASHHSICVFEIAWKIFSITLKRLCYENIQIYGNEIFIMHDFLCKYFNAYYDGC